MLKVHIVLTANFLGIETGLAAVDDILKCERICYFISGPLRPRTIRNGVKHIVVLGTSHLILNPMSRSRVILHYLQHRSLFPNKCFGGGGVF